MSAGCFLAACVFSIPVSTDGLTDAEKAIEAKYQQVADSLEYFATEDFLFDRVPIALRMHGGKEYCELLRSCVSYHLFSPLVCKDDYDWRCNPYAWSFFLEDQITILKKMANHPDAGVRTLALATLYNSESLEAFEEIACHVDDQTPTWPSLDANLASYPVARQVWSVQLSQTVGDVARSMLDFAGWNVEQGPPDPVDWMAFRVRRATQGYSNPPYGRRSRLQTLFNYTVDMEPVTREICILQVFAEKGFVELLDNERQLIYAARRLGRERLFEWLETGKICDSPCTELHWSTRVFLLDHARDIFKSEDADRILELGRKGGGLHFYMAAADLQPGRSVDILREGLMKLPSYEWKHDLFWRFWCAGGAAEASFCLERFFGEKLELGSTPERAYFVRQLLDRYQPEDQALLSRIVEDERFDSLDWATLQEIAKGLNNNCLQPVVSPQSIVCIRHPMGVTHLHGMLEEAEEEYPEETHLLLDTLAEWKKAIRDHISQEGD